MTNMPDNANPNDSAVITSAAEALGVAADAFTQARDMIRAEGTSCVVLRDGAVIHTADGRGVSPLMALYRGDVAKLSGSAVVDRVIGKAAAMILTLAQAKAVYGDVMSLAAQDYLAARGIAYAHGESVDMIVNQQGDGMCPIEQSVIAIDDPAQGLAAMSARINELMGGAN